MSYLLDKQAKRKKILVAFLVAVIIFLFFNFRTPIFNGLSLVTNFIFKPVFSFGQNVGDKFSSFGEYFSSKNTLLEENKSLELQLNESKARTENYDVLLAENQRIKGIMSRAGEKKNLILSSILTSPDHSLYNSILIDVGSEKGIKVENVVFAYGNIPIGRIVKVFSSSSKVVLFSSPGEKTDAFVAVSSKTENSDVVKQMPFQLIGRGGGNFEMVAPRDFSVPDGEKATLPGITPYVVAEVQTIISDPRDSFQKILLISPVNVQEIKFVQVDVK